MPFGKNNNISGIFTRSIHNDEPSENEGDIQTDNYVFEKNGDEVEEPANETIPEEKEPVKKEPIKTRPPKNKDSTLIYSVTAKVSPEEKDLLNDIEVAFGEDTAKALRRCIKHYQEGNGEEVKSIAKRIRRIRFKQ